MFAKIEPIVYNFCVHEVCNCSEAQDLVQETFFRFLLTLDDFRAECCLQTRIIGIAISVCKNHHALTKYKKRDAEVCYLSEVNDIQEVIKDKYAVSPLEILIQQEQQVQLENVCRSLTNEQRTAF